MEEQKIQAHRATNSTMVTYGFGSIGVGIKNNLLGTWLLFYYNGVLGLDAILVASAMATALIVDAISDPLVGIWSDRVRSKWGRRHPFMYFAIIPFSLSFYFILQDPRPLSEAELFNRLLFLMIIMRLSMTFYEVPRAALAPELTKDYYQRNTISSWGMAFGWIGGAGISFIHQYFFLGDSFTNASGYQLLAFWGGLGIFISTAVTSIGTHKHINNLHKLPPKQAFHAPDEFIQKSRFTVFNLRPVSTAAFRGLCFLIGKILPKQNIKFLQAIEYQTGLFLSQAKETLSNRSWIVLFCSGCIYALLVGIDTGAGTYYNNFFWEWKPTDIAVFSITSALAVILFSVLAPFIAYGRSKKKVAVGVFLTTIFIGPLPLVLRLIDPYFEFQTFPSNGTDAIWYILMIHAAFAAALGSLGFIFIGSMAMEIVEDIQVETGRREEGLLGTVNSFIHKLIGAGGVLIAGFIVSYAGFDDTSSEELLYGTVINKFALIHVVIGFILPLFSTLLILFYSIDRKEHLDNVSDLGYVEKK